MYQLYGISNCDTVKKAKNFLEESGVDFEFIDFKKQKPTSEEIKLWSKKFGGLPVNKSGRTYKQHKEQFESASESEQIQLLKEQTSLIKRPILMDGKKTIAFGFKQDEYQQVFEKLK